MEYKITEELKDIFLEYTSAIECRDKAIEKCFFTSRAIKYGKIAERKKIEFWIKVYELYPEIKGKKMQYNIAGNFISELDKEIKG